MNVSCPECQSVFRVDPARVPGPGIRARCSVCGGIIPITAARSWTDDFATPHDAASLTSSSRPAARSSAGAAATAGPPLAERPAPGSALGGTVGRLTPPAGLPRSATPTRVPPFSPGRRPTPQGMPPVPQTAAPSPVAESRAAMPSAASAPQVPVAASQPAAAAPRVVQPRTEPDVAKAAPAASPPPVPPRRPEVPFGAPMSRPVAAAPPAAPQPIARPAGAGAPGQSTSGGAAPTPDSVSATPAKAPINPFLANDPNQKAKRLARALVSDMVAYHPQKRDEGMRAGTLKQLFREEIKKSYEEYVEQIGKEFAESTSHFQDALNDVLASGKKVF